MAALNSSQVYRDAFTSREKANEDLFIRKREAEKLAAMKQKAAEQGKGQGYVHLFG